MQSLWMLFASFAFAIMGVCVKLASDYYSTSEIVMYRGLVGMAFIALLTKTRGGTLKTTLPWHHLHRGAIGVTALWLWFFSMSTLPLATAMTLNYMSPIWMATILFFSGWWHGRSRFEWGLVAAIAASFAGVTLLLQPSFQSNQWFGSIIALGSGMLSALAYLQVKQLGLLGEPEYRVVFYFSSSGVVGGLLGTLITMSFSNHPASWHAHHTKGLLLLLGVGLCATLAQMAMTRAYRLGNTLVTANLQYTGIVFSTLCGMLVWHDIPTAVMWIGMLIILGSGIITTFYNKRSTQAPTLTIEPADGIDPIAAEV